MPSIDYSALRSAISIEQVLDLLEFTHSAREGDKLRGPCPIHRSKSPQSRSFSVNLSRNAFRCFTCGAQGNQLDLWSKARKLPLYEAAIDLCRGLQIELPTLETQPPTDTEKRNP
jgi:DNA primase